MALDFSTAEFDCGHTQKVRLPVESWSWCEECGDTRNVITVREYRYACHDCSAGGLYGGALILAQRGASRHRGRHPGHRVGVFYGERFVTGERALTGDGAPARDTLF